MWRRRIGELSVALRLGLGDSLFPKTCAGCGFPGEWFCTRCVPLLRRDPGPGCRRCGRPGYASARCTWCEPTLPPGLTELRAAFMFGGPLRQAIHRFKYLRERERGRDLGQRLATCTPELFTRIDNLDAIVPVPLHPRRRRQRGFNQSAVLAEELSSALDVPLIDGVQRVRNTPTQTQLDVNQRARNVAGAFAINKHESLAGKRLLIVDDVTTTGATIGAVATVLMRAGATSLIAVAVAREGFRDHG